MELIKSSDGSVILVTLNTYISELKALIFWTESIEDEKFHSAHSQEIVMSLFYRSKTVLKNIAIVQYKVLSFIAAIKSFVKSTNPN